MLEGKVFMVTGSTGRIGCELTARLEDLGADVVPVVLGGYPTSPKRINWSAQSYPLKVNNIKDLKKVPLPEYLINLHWQVNRNLPFSMQLTYELQSNVTEISFFWDWVAGLSLKRFINVSTIKVFSELNERIIKSNTEPRPITPYGIAKLTAEKYYDALFHISSFPTTHLRLCSVASFGEHPSQLMSQLCQSAFKKNRIKLYALSNTSIIYIEEVIDLIISAAVNATDERYLIAKKIKTNAQIAKKFEQISKRVLDAEYIDIKPKIKNPVFISDIKKLRTSWMRTYSLDQMIEAIIHKFNDSNTDK
jgi:nucleoside-diphosphate-sugar epimerase